MIRVATRNDLPALKRLFATSNDAPYDLAAVAEEKCFGRGIAGEPVTRVIEENERIVAASTTCGRWLRLLVVDRRHRRRGLGTALLEGEVVAAEPGNYFTPGVFDAGSMAFLRARGYAEGAATQNLVCIPRKISHNLLRGTQGPVLDFIEREFGRIWRFEASKGNVLWLEHEGRPAGFAAWDANNRGLGWFGPTGVAKALRGRGYGRELLLATLSDMADRYAEAVIPWTDAVEFYAKSCGAKPAHRFVAFVRDQR